MPNANKLMSFMYVCVANALSNQYAIKIILKCNQYTIIIW